MLPKNHIEQLKEHGERITPIRTALIAILAKTTEPRTPQELLADLAKKGFRANKTTIYRQLEVLQHYNIVQEVRFADRTKRYELASESGHHHHLVCLQCQCIEDVAFPTDLDKQEKAIWEKHTFKVLQHSLEFFGICKSCQTKGK